MDIVNKADNLELIASVYQVSSAAMAIMDEHCKVLTINAAFANMTGFNLLEIVGQSIAMICDFSISQASQEDIWLSINETGSWRGEVFIGRKTEGQFPATALFDCIRQLDGRITHYMLVFLDISKHKALEDELRYHAEIDPLTRLPNRKLFFQHLEAAFASAMRFNYNVALLYLDLDGFKGINDNLGHGQGDNVLIEVSRRLIACVREVDTAARLGGDEFVIILNGTSKKMIALTAQRIIDTLTIKIKEKGIEMQVSASIGISVYPEDSVNPQELLKYADEAMYNAKYKGKSQFCWHESENLI